MKKVLMATALALIAGAVSAAPVTVTITSGTWLTETVWNNNADASPVSIYNGGEAAPPVLLAGAPSTFTWNDDAGNPQTVPDFTGVIGGSLTYDDATGIVISGSLDITGTIGDTVVVGGNSWWLRVWGDVSIDLLTGVATTGSTTCYRTLFAPANCDPSVLAGMPFQFFIADGAITPGACYLPGATNDPANDPTSTAPPCGPDGPAQPKAVFDAVSGTLTLFNEGRSATGNVNGTDLQTTWALQTAVVPVPAAVWLFGSALGLLGWVRRRVA